MATQAVSVRSNVSAGSWAPVSGNPSDFVSSVLSTDDPKTTSITIDDGSTDGDGTFISYFRMDSSALPSDAICTQLDFSAAYAVETNGDFGPSIDVGWALKNELNVNVVPGTSLVNFIGPDMGQGTMTASTPLLAVTTDNLNLYQVGIYDKFTGSSGDGNLIVFVNALSLIVTYTSASTGNIRRSQVVKFWRN